MNQPRDLAFGWNLSAKHLQAIGEVAVRWSALEFTISWLIWEFADLPGSLGWAITAHLSERTRVDICNSLTFEVLGDTALTGELRTHLNFIITTVYPKRNKFVHSRWGASMSSRDKSEVQTVKARGKVTIGSEQFTSDDILVVAKDIFDANEKLVNIRSQIRPLLYALSNRRGV